MFVFSLGIRYVLVCLFKQFRKSDSLRPVHSCGQSLASFMLDVVLKEANQRLIF